MATKIYGASDDLIEFESDRKQDIGGEVGCYGTDNKDKGVLIICSDGTLLEVKYGKAEMGIWGITLLNQGHLFEKIDLCMDENANPYSDVAHFKHGLKWAYTAEEWERVN